MSFTPCLVEVKIRGMENGGEKVEKTKVFSYLVRRENLGRKWVVLDIFHQSLPNVISPNQRKD